MFKTLDKKEQLYRILKDYAANENGKGDIKATPDCYARDLIAFLFDDIIKLNADIEKYLATGNTQMAFYRLGQLDIAINEIGCEFDLFAKSEKKLH